MNMSEIPSYPDDKEGSTTPRIVELGLIWEFLQWTDAMHLGSTCHALRNRYFDNEPHVLGPLLTHLENMVGSHRSIYCFHALAPLCKCKCSSAQSRQRPALAVLDPRYQMSYQILMSCKTKRKQRCLAMTAFISKIVSNMQSQFDCDNLAEPSKLPFTFGILQEWEFLWPREDDFPMERLMEEIPRRLTFAFNLASLAFGADALNAGGHVSVDDAFLGKGKIMSRSEFGLGASITLVGLVESMFPFRDVDFVAFLQRIHPSIQTLDTLGPTLSYRLLLCYPKGQGIVLPDDLEPELELSSDGNEPWVFVDEDHKHAIMDWVDADET